MTDLISRAEAIDVVCALCPYKEVCEQADRLGNERRCITFKALKEIPTKNGKRGGK